MSVCSETEFKYAITLLWIVWVQYERNGFIKVSLVIRKDVAEELYKRIDRNGYPEDIYASWKRNVIEIMEERKQIWKK